LDKRKEQLIQILIAVIAAITIIIIFPIALIAYSYTQLKIRSRELRKKLKDAL